MSSIKVGDEVLLKSRDHDDKIVKIVSETKTQWTIDYANRRYNKKTLREVGFDRRYGDYLEQLGANHDD